MKPRQWLIAYVFMLFALLAWNQFLLILYPAPPREEIERRKAEKLLAKAKEQELGESITTATSEKGEQESSEGDQKSPESEPADSGEAAEETKQPPKMEAAPAPPRIDQVQIQLGSREPKSPFLLEAVFTNRGAAIESIVLNRYDNENRSRRLTLFGQDKAQRPSYLLGMSDQSLDRKNWEIVDAGKDHVTFRTRSDDGKLEFEKRFHLPENSYFMDLDVVVRNVSDATVRDATYWIQSGNGLEIEGKWYTRYYRQFVIAMRPKEGEAFLKELTVDRVASGSVRPFAATPIQFAGVVNQYFASLLIQKPDPRDDRLIASVEPIVIERDRVDVHFTNFTANATSTAVTLEPAEEIVHAYHLFNGPKSEEVLNEEAGEGLPLLLHYPAIFGIPTGWIARPMIALLRFLYSYVGDYGIAIILLTVVVRSCMFPLSYTTTLKTQSMAKKMQIIQPQVEEVKKKYENDKEKLNRALMDLYAKNELNPLGGCLFPILLIFMQIPIFGGLYQALSLSLDLRQAPFLWGYTWIDDLSAPDRLFPFPFVLPFLGPYFNLLPILAAVQFTIQMRLTMPPATTPEMEMQQKIMRFMPWMMAFMFYNVPSGLCIYFVTSGLWTMVERQLLPKSILTPHQPATTTGTANAGAAGSANPTKPSTNGSSGSTSWKKPVDKKKKRK